MISITRAVHEYYIYANHFKLLSNISLFDPPLQLSVYFDLY